jgi:hypothetical protein
MENQIISNGLLTRTENLIYLRKKSEKSLKNSNRKVIEESMPSHLETHGMLLSFSFESDLSHTSILYYYNIRKMKIFEYWSQGVSKNKKEISIP